MGMQPALSGHRRGCLLGLCLLLCAFVSVPSVQRVGAATTNVDLTGRLTAGANHTCAIASDDSVWCWGDNTYLQLGTTDVAVKRSSPIAVNSTLRALQVAAGSNHTCLLAPDKSVWCWGHNSSSALGSAGVSVSAAPLRVELDRDAVAIAAGGNSSCAVLASQVVKCWGANTNRQLGNGTSTNSVSPTQVSKVPSDFTVAQLDMGANHTCAVSATGAVWCWGLEEDGRLGRNSPASAFVPEPTYELGDGVMQVSAGGQHTCVSFTTAKLKCFGSNNAGQLGWEKSTTHSSGEPLQVTNVVAAVAVAAGGDHTCVRTTSSTVQCFGYNNFGQIGVSQNSPTDRHQPEIVSGATDIVDIVAGLSHTCTVVVTGEVKCWGSNMSGQLGANVLNATHVPTTVVSFNVKPPAPEPEPEPAPEPVPVPVPVPEPAPALAPVSGDNASPATSPAISPGVSTQTNTNITSDTSPPVKSDEALLNAVVVPIVAEKKPLVSAVRLKKGRSITAAKIAASVTIAIPKKSQGTMRISIMTGAKNCKFVGSTIRAVRRGKCQVLVVRIPKVGRPLLRGNTITIV